MRLRLAILLIALPVAGCGTSAPEAAMPARSWEYYVAHSTEIEPMQKICREWSGSSATAASQPAVVTTNCRAAAFAKTQLQLRK